MKFLFFFMTILLFILCSCFANPRAYISAAKVTTMHEIQYSGQKDYKDDLMKQRFDMLASQYDTSKTTLMKLLDANQSEFSGREILSGSSALKLRGDFLGAITDSELNSAGVRTRTETSTSETVRADVPGNLPVRSIEQVTDAAPYNPVVDLMKDSVATKFLTDTLFQPTPTSPTDHPLDIIGNADDVFSL